MGRIELAPSAALTAAREYAAALRDRYGDRIVAVSLFGSLVRGEADEDSDVDIAVVLTELDHKDRRDLIDLAARAGLRYDVVLSPLLFDQATWITWCDQQRPLVMDILREGLAL